MKPTVLRLIRRQGSVDRLLKKMEQDWDERARTNARHFIATGQLDWSLNDFLQSGMVNVRDQILTDMQNICQGRDPKQMRVLEIGCGAGRLLYALAQVFGEVHGVDVSGEMVKLAREICGSFSNAFVYRNNGTNLSVVGHLTFDFAFSFIVFQHIPSKAVIENYIRETHRLLRPGGLFKFQVTGCPGNSPRSDTWFGAGISEPEAREMASGAVSSSGTRWAVIRRCFGCGSSSRVSDCTPHCLGPADSLKLNYKLFEGAKRATSGCRPAR